jgi:phosphatidylserine decarboxylase
MKHAGKARSAALQLIFLSLIGVAVVGFCAWLLPLGPVFSRILHLPGGGEPVTVFGHPGFLSQAIIDTVIPLWVLFVVFTLYFFRDPAARTPTGPGLAVSPGHGRVDYVGQLDDQPFMGGPCHRISIFLSVINVHVQNAPVSGRINCVVHTPGKFISALKSDSAAFNENVLIGFDSTERIGEKIGLRLIAGVLARRIVPFVMAGDEVARGGRISLIQFGSRCDLYLPLQYQIKVKPGDKVVGGETIMASR